jgi:mono/diheme cytochrome c family protein
MDSKVNSMKKILGVSVVSACIALAVGTAHALPFNSDMVDVQIRTGKIMRPKAEGSISKGSLPLMIDNKQEVAAWTNPMKGDADSAFRGKRLYDVNCLPCHGSMDVWPHEPGVAGKFIGAPDLRAEVYSKQRTDGSIFGTIHFGGMALMPGYGWKLSHTEHWDIISYVRKAQAASEARTAQVGTK